MNVFLGKGNLTRDPEVKFIPSGTAVCEFGIAISERWTDDQGNKKESTYFGECQCWGKRGETLAKFFTKGKPILIRGKLAQEEWEDKQTGQKRSKTRIKVEEWEFCGGDKDEGSREDHQQESGRAQQPRQQQRDYAVNRGQPRQNTQQAQRPGAGWTGPSGKEFDDSGGGGGADSGEIPFAPFNEPHP